MREKAADTAPWRSPTGWGRIPLAFQPERSWCYGTSADVAGAVVEVVSGMRFGDFLEKELFAPLEMCDTGFWVPEEKQDRLVKTYVCTEGEKPALYTKNHLDICNRMDRRPAFESGGADWFLRLTIILILRRCF